MSDDFIEKCYVPDGPEEEAGAPALPADAFTLVFAGDIRDFPNPLTTETPFGIAIGAADRDLMAEREAIEEEDATEVTIPRAQYEALMALRQIIAEMAYARAPLNDRVYRECRTALVALRDAGIHETEGGER